MKRHRHQWTETARVFVPPSQRQVRYKGSNEETLDRVLFGVTSIEMRCDCGDVAERHLLGDHTPVRSSTQPPKTVDVTKLAAEVRRAMHEDRRR